MVSVFEIKAKVSGSFNIDEEFFSQDLTFEDFPENTMGIIQIQLGTDQTSILEVTLNGTDYFFLNNGTGISGLATFTMAVDKNTILNMRNSDVAGLAVTITVGQ